MTKTEMKDMLSQIQKNFGKESIMTLSDRPKIIKDIFSTGILSLDLALGVGGYPKGRIIEVYGPESSGKTTLALQAIAEAQKNKMQCAFIDAEHAVDPDYAKNLGVNVNDLILSQPDSGEQALAIVESLVKTHAVDLIVVDSVAALVPQVELNGEMSDQTIGAQARLMSKALRKLSGVLNKSRCTIIFINQIRMKIGVMFGNPETTPGGRALKFYSTMRLEVRASTKINQDNKLIGNDVKIKVVKNKVAPPFKVVITPLIYGKGFDTVGDIIEIAVELDFVEKAGSWFSYKNKKIGQGKNKAIEYFNSNIKLLEELKTKIKKLSE